MHANITRLTLSRTPGESITIKVGLVELTVLIREIRGQKTQLNIAAPRHVKIMRTELLPAPEPQLLSFQPAPQWQPESDLVPAG